MAGCVAHNSNSFDPRFQVLRSPEDGLIEIQESVRLEMLKHAGAARYVHVSAVEMCMHCVLIDCVLRMGVALLNVVRSYV